MSYAQDNLACASWTNAGDPVKERRFCGQPAGHFGDHMATYWARDVLQSATWPNKTPGLWPDWMRKTTVHALRLALADTRMTKRVYALDIQKLLDTIKEVQGE
jgi:hypothetical protein